MGFEQSNFESDTPIEIQGYKVKLSPTQNPDYSFVKISKDGVVLETVVENETGELAQAVDITDAPREFIQHAKVVMQPQAPALIKEALGITDNGPTQPDSVSDPEWEKIVADEKEIRGLSKKLDIDVPVYSEKKQHIAQASHLSKSRGDKTNT